MGKLIIVLLVFFSANIYSQDVPFLPLADFEFELDYDFKSKPPPDKNKVTFTEKTPYSADLLPYVKVNFSFTNLPEEAFRVRVVNLRGGIVKSKKVKNLDILEFDMGFSDDIKDRVEPHAYYIYIENKTKDYLSKVKIFVDESGDFYLNDEPFGKI